MSAEPLDQLTPLLDAAFAARSSAAFAGDLAARREILNTCRDYLLFIANQELDHRLQGKCAPSDVVQNTLIKAVEHFADFQGTNQHALLAWVRQILKNEIIDVRRAYLRAEKRDLRKECPADDDALLATERPEIVDPEHTPSTHAELRDDAERLQRALQLLSPDYEAVIRLRNWERLPFAEIGRRMNRSEDAAKKLESAVIAGIRSANVLRARAGLTTQEIIPVQFAKSLPRWPFGN